MKRYLIIFAFLLLLPFVHSFTPSHIIPYVSCCADVVKSLDGKNDSLKTDLRYDMIKGIPTCCQYSKNPEECYACFEQKREEYKSENIKSVLLISAYFGAIILLSALLLINKLKKEKFLNDTVRKILFWILMILIIIPLLFIFFFSIYSGIPIF